MSCWRVSDLDSSRQDTTTTATTTRVWRERKKEKREKKKQCAIFQFQFCAKQKSGDEMIGARKMNERSRAKCQQFARHHSRPPPFVSFFDGGRHQHPSIFRRRIERNLSASITRIPYISLKNIYRPRYISIKKIDVGGREYDNDNNDEEEQEQEQEHRRRKDFSCFFSSSSCIILKAAYKV